MRNGIISFVSGWLSVSTESQNKVCLLEPQFKSFYLYCHYTKVLQKFAVHSEWKHFYTKPVGFVLLFSLTLLSIFQVNPQFDYSIAAVPPLRRGRRKCQSATGILDSVSQLPRKTSVCKFPALSFQTGSRHQAQNSRGTHTKKVSERSVVSKVKNQPTGSCQPSITASAVNCSETPKRRLAKLRKRNAGTFSDGAVSHRRCSDQLTAESGRISADGASTPASSELSTSVLSGVDPPPDVDLPKIRQEGSCCSSTPFVHPLLGQPCTPPCDKQPDILVADTPERDYGVKATWRRRKTLMLTLKERGYLSESDVLIHCWLRVLSFFFFFSSNCGNNYLSVTTVILIRGWMLFKNEIYFACLFYQSNHE